MQNEQKRNKIRNHFIAKINFSNNKRRSQFYFVISAQNGINKKTKQTKNKPKMSDVEPIQSFRDYYYFYCFCADSCFSVDSRCQSWTCFEVFAACVNCIRKCIQTRPPNPVIGNANRAFSTYLVHSHTLHHSRLHNPT